MLLILFTKKWTKIELQIKQDENIVYDFGERTRISIVYRYCNIRSKITKTNW